MTKKQDYIVRSDGWVAGRPVTAGEAVRLSEQEARYEPVDPAASDASAAVEPARRGKTRPEAGA